MRYILAFLFLFVTACSTTPAAYKQEVVEPVHNSETPIEISPGIEVDEFALPPFAWDNAEWDKKVIEKILERGLDKVSIKDASELCPKYSSLDESQRVQFWGVFLVAISKRESGYKPDTTYTESFKNSRGEKVISTGLFQLSYESASSSAYECGKQTTAKLKEPINNINCGSNIVAKWVKQSGYALGQVGSDTKNQLGCGRYFSTCRPPSASRAYIVKQVSALPFCK